MAIFLKRAFVALLTALLIRADDENIYTDNAIASDWQDWSWGTTTNYAATDIMEGTSSISITSEAWSALSLKAPAPFTSMIGFRFDISVGQNYSPRTRFL